MDENKKLGLVAVGALIVGGLTTLGGTTALKGDETDVPVTLEAIPSGIVKLDAGDDALPEPEPVGPRTTDLDSEIVQPGERVVSEVNLPEGWAPVGEFTLTGEATCFKIIASQMVGQTLKVMAENGCEAPTRFAATFQYDKVITPP